MRVLVTGGLGRLGRSVVLDLIDRDHEVLVADLGRGEVPPGVDLLPVDLTEPADAYAAISRCRAQAVIHLAGVAEPFSRPPHTLFAANTLGTFHVVEACLAMGVQTVVYAGSPTPIGYGSPSGWLPQYLPIDEDHPIAPWHEYAVSKVVGETVLAAAARRSAGALHALTVRPCFVVAPEDWSNRQAGQAGHTIRQRLDDPALAATSLFNYVDARDAASLIRMVLENAEQLEQGGTFFASADDALAREPLSELLPRYYPGVADLARGLTGTTPAFSTAKARRQLGWRPRYSWRDQLATN
jgi:UDP-glucose 4-epimerase